jgi:hypothetical protein
LSSNETDEDSCDTAPETAAPAAEAAPLTAVTAFVAASVATTRPAEEPAAGRAEGCAGTAAAEDADEVDRRKGFEDAACGAGPKADLPGEKNGPERSPALDIGENDEIVEEAEADAEDVGIVVTPGDCGGACAG